MVAITNKHRYIDLSFVDNSGGCWLPIFNTEDTTNELNLIAVFGTGYQVMDSDDVELAMLRKIRANSTANVLVKKTLHKELISDITDMGYEVFLW